MAKKMLIDATHPEETRVVVADGNKVEEFDFESLNKRQLAGNIYLAKVTRVEPSLQAAFIEYGGNRHGFLAFAEIHPDYYQIPKADREAILAEERAMAEAQAAEDEAAATRGATRGDDAEDDGSDVEEIDAPSDGSEDKPKKSRGRSRSRSRRRKSEDDGNDGTPADAETVISEDGEDAVVTGGAAELSEAAIETGDAESVTTIAESAGLEDEIVTDGAVTEAHPEPSGMETVDLGDDDDDGDPVEDAEPSPRRSRTRGRRKAASEKDDSVETVGEAEAHDDHRAPRTPRPKARKYKIQEVVKVRQIMLVQVVKEERGNKGAALTTYLSLAGRYCVLMPNTARGGGISRKITNVVDRKKLKEIAQEIDVPQGAGLIVRTAGAKRTKSEIKRDYEYLQRQWEQVRELTLKSIAPAPIYEEGNLIHRSIRDLYSREIDEVLVEGEAGFREAKDYMRLIMPTHAKNVKLHAEPTPLFARHGVESYLSSMFSPTVQLKSGGYIVIGITEALVAIDVNSGKSTKEGSIEDTATKTNLEAADEVARQMRLRDLAGLIVIDFIDMDERRNNAAVEKRMKDALKGDRARIQMGRISGFGLMEMSRQRLRPGMLEATTQPCSHCHGTGLIRSDDSVALQVLRALEEEGGRQRTREVLARLPVKVANYLMNDKREHLAAIEQRYDMAVRIEADPTLIGDDFPAFEKFKTTTRVIAKPSQAVHADTSWTSEQDDLLDAEAAASAQADEEEAREAEDAPEAPSGRGEVQDEDRTDERADSRGEGRGERTTSRDDRSEGEEGPRKKRRRRSRRRKGNSEGSEDRGEANGPTEDTAETVADTGEILLDASADVAPETVTSEGEDKPKARSRSRSRSKAVTTEEGTGDAIAAEPASEATEPQEDAPKPKSRRRSRSKIATPETGASADLGEVAAVADAAVASKAEPMAVEPDVTPEPVAERQPLPEPEFRSEPEAAAETQEAAKPKRKGWWSFGS